MKDCLFCKIYSEKKFFYENEFFYSRWDEFPVTVGHTEIIPKKHIVSLMDLSHEEWAYLKPAISETIKIIENTDFDKLYKKMLKEPVNQKAEKLLQRVINSPYINQKPQAYNHGNNDGKAAGRTINHLHWHIIPRYSNDVVDPRGGIRNILPNVGNYRK